MDKDTLISNIEAAAERRGVKVTPACINAGVGRTFITDIRKGSVPSVEKIQKLASYLGVSTSELLGEEIPKEPTTPQGNELSQKFATLFDQLTPEQKELVVKTMREMNKGK